MRVYRRIVDGVIVHRVVFSDEGIPPDWGSASEFEEELEDIPPQIGWTLTKGEWVAPVDDAKEAPVPEQSRSDGGVVVDASSLLDELRGATDVKVDEIVDRAFQIEHCLTDVDQLGRTLANDVNAQQPPRLAREDHFHESLFKPHDLTARAFAQPRDPTFVIDAFVAHFLLGQANSRNLRHGIDAIGEELRRRRQR